ncbi:MAG: hypothetical protein ACLUB2_04115 [Butyricicoccus pullicaecorum]
MVQCYQAMFYETFSSTVPLMQTFVLYGSPMCNYLVTFHDTHTMYVPLFDTALDVVGGMAVLIYPIILTIELGVLSYFLFVRRKSENTGMAVSFRDEGTDQVVYEHVLGLGIWLDLHCNLFRHVWRHVVWSGLWCGSVPHGC